MDIASRSRRRLLASLLALPALAHAQAALLALGAAMVGMRGLSR